MFSRMFYASCAAGLLAGLVLTLIQALQVTPLILAAETFEGGNAPALATGESPVATAAADQGSHDHGSHDHGGHHHGDAWAPEDGIERTAWTAISNVGMSIGFALMLCAVFAWVKAPNTWDGLKWGLAGFVVFFGSPALGLHPELPGTAAANLGDRQLWWTFAVISAAAGVGCLLVARHWAVRVGGIALLVVPHVVGAPHPEVANSLVPAEMLRDFAFATAFANIAFWLVLGTATSGAYRWLVKPA